VLREATPEDFAAMLELNEESVRFLAPLTLDQLTAIHGESAYRRVFVDR
jgi:hypothetical protein